jgi:hypothetical protein
VISITSETFIDDHKCRKVHSRQWLTPVILATREAEIRRMNQANRSRDPISKKPTTKKGWWSGSSYRPEFKLQYCKKKSEEKYIFITLHKENIHTMKLLFRSNESVTTFSQSYLHF